MAILSLDFRLDELTQEGRPFKGEIQAAAVAESVNGLVGKLGFREQGPLSIEGTVYKSAGNEVVVDATFSTQLGFDCVRCLESRDLAISLRVDRVLVEGEEDADDDDDEDDRDVYHYSGERVDLSDMFREDLVLALPMNPQCESVGAECAEQTLDPSAEEATVDPRWAPLLEMKKKLNSR